MISWLTGGRVLVLMLGALRHGHKASPGDLDSHYSINIRVPKNNEHSRFLYKGLVIWIGPSTLNLLLGPSGREVLLTHLKSS